MNKYRLVYGLLITSLLILFSCSQDINQLESRLNEYVEAVNRHDKEKIASFYADDINFAMSGGAIFGGKDILLKLEDWSSAVNTQWKVSDVSIAGDTVHCKIIETNDWFFYADIDSVYYDTVSFVFRDNLLTDIIMNPNTESQKEIEAVSNTVGRWAYEERPEELKALFDGGQTMSYNKETAQKWIDLIKDWRYSMGLPEKEK